MTAANNLTKANSVTHTQLGLENTHTSIHNISHRTTDAKEVVSTWFTLNSPAYKIRRAPVPGQWNSSDQVYEGNFYNINMLNYNKESSNTTSIRRCHEWKQTHTRTATFIGRSQKLVATEWKVPNFGTSSIHQICFLLPGPFTIRIGIFSVIFTPAYCDVYHFIDIMKLPFH